MPPWVGHGPVGGGGGNGLAGATGVSMGGCAREVAEEEREGRHRAARIR